MTAEYLLCGWQVRSDVAIPELPRWRGPAQPSGLRIRLGEVPDLPGAPGSGEMGFHIEPGGDCLLQVADVARFWVRGGAEVVIRPVREATAPEVRVFLLGSVLGFLCHQRGVLPLHASCVRIGGRAVAICAPSGTGKSTLAAALVARGHGMMADDVLVIRPETTDVHPTFPRLKLAPAAAERLGFDPGAALAVPSEAGKLHLPLPGGSAAPVPLAAIAVLRPAGAGDDRVARLRGVDAMTALHMETFRREMARMSGRAPALFALLAGVVRHVPVYSVPTTRDWSALDGLADSIETLAQGGA